ncbi:MAG: ATP-binding cassette domain-containing protein [Gammaproteobacteria bacterium]|nr:ATP-binding cassette domain-containing protein [Gammaproteobacteria bacterium]NND61004.1 ATP-binding cassette domain-containing protein [Gammaproteobacteria bacterium]
MTSDQFEFDLQLERRDGFCLQAAASVPLGSIVGVFGDSAAGKTSLLRALAGFEKQCRGLTRLGDTVLLDSDAQFCVPPWERPFGMVFQEAALFAHLDVGGNLDFARRRTETVDENWLSQFDLAPLLSRPVAQLSGGQQQRVALARTLLQQPRVLLLDEALAGLDRATRDRLRNRVIGQSRSVGRTVFIVSHDIDELTQSCDHLLVMRDGMLTDSGETAALLRDPEVMHAADVGVIVDSRVGSYDADAGLTTLLAGSVELRVPGRLDGNTCTLRILARDVSLVATEQTDTSILNRVPGVVSKLVVDGDLAWVTIDCHDFDLVARLSRHSAHHLGLSTGRQVIAQIKAAAMRG